LRDVFPAVGGRSSPVVFVVASGVAVVLVEMSLDALSIDSLVVLLFADPLGGTVCVVVCAMTATGRAAAISQRAVLFMIIVRRLVGQG